MEEHTKIKIITDKFLKSFKSIGVKLSPNVEVRISRNMISIGIHHPDEVGSMTIASEINIYSDYPDSYDSLKLINEINVGTSGSFTPDDEAPYWRIIHAAEILTHWEEVTSLVNFTCLQYADFVDSLRKAKLNA